MIIKTVSTMLSLFIILTLTACGSPAASTEQTTSSSDTATNKTTAATINTIMTIGTTQAFTDESVPKEDIQTILQAGLASESAINQQPWYFAAITNKEIMKEISGAGSMSGNAAKPPMPENGTTPAKPQGDAPMPSSSGGTKAALGDSPLAIIVYVDENTSSPNANFDCGLAAQNMYIAAASLGYGVKIISSPTMTLNGADHDQICEKLGVDKSLNAAAVLLIGKADKSTDAVSSASTRAGLNDKTKIIE